MTLPAIQSPQHKIGLLELDIAPALADYLALDLQLSDDVAQMQKLLQKIGAVGLEYCTGLILDPVYSFKVAKKPGKAGILMRMTPVHQKNKPPAVPALNSNYGLEEMRNNYTLAKLELPYHPQEKNALRKKKLLAEIYDYCDYLNINLLLKLIIYSPSDQELTPDAFQEAQLRAVQELRNNVDLLALQSPADPLTSATLTAELDIPWILMGENHNYEEFKQKLRMCLENGAAGFCAGLSLYPEIKNYKLETGTLDLEKITRFFNTTLQDRLIELMRISEES